MRLERIVAWRLWKIIGHEFSMEIFSHLFGIAVNKLIDRANNSLKTVVWLTVLSQHFIQQWIFWYSLSLQFLPWTGTDTRFQAILLSLRRPIISIFNRNCHVTLLRNPIHWCIRAPIEMFNAWIFVLFMVVFMFECGARHSPRDTDGGSAL